MTFDYTAAGECCRIVLGRGALARLGAELAALAPHSRAMIVTDETVAPLYLERVRGSLRTADIDSEAVLLRPGESAKTAESYVELLCRLAGAGLTRSDTVLALGGGVIGDLAGFAAATYLRGIRLVQLPTTLLAMADACIGGKCAIDLPAGKNLAGAFHQPALSLCDVSLLDSLPPELLREGCAELIKIAILFDPTLFEHLERFGPDFDREWAVARALRHKARLVSEDPFDTGERRLLNLGHTLGHAIEACSGFSELHGNAVSVGLAAMARGFCRDSRRILALLDAFSLPTTTKYPAAALAKAALHDKKRSGATLHLIVPREIGRCEIVDYPSGRIAELWEEVLGA